jgi:hypothetical protein
MTPAQLPGVPLPSQIASARREHASLIKQRDFAAEAIIQLSDALATLEPSPGVVDQTSVNPTEERLDRACSALSALIEVRLLELQMMHESLVARTDELEALLTTADGGDLGALSRAIPKVPSQHEPNAGVQNASRPLHKTTDR